MVQVSENTNDFLRLSREIVAPLLYANKINALEGLEYLNLKNNRKNRDLLKRWRYREEDFSEEERVQRLKKAEQNCDLIVQRTKDIEVSKSAEIVEDEQTALVTTEKYSQNLNSVGLADMFRVIKGLQQGTLARFGDEQKSLSALYERLSELTPKAKTPNDLLRLAQALDKLAEISRKTALLPYGLKDLPKNDSNTTSQHVHFHNHGLKDFQPK